MVSTALARPNHYETLGLTPAATADEIAQAFARELGRPLAFGGIAQVGLAYETLRDAAKREAYDVSLGLRPEPQPQPTDAAAKWREGSQFFAFASPHPAEQTIRDTSSPQVERPVAPKTAPFIAAAAPRAAGPAPPPRAAAEPARRPEPAAMPKPDLVQELRLAVAEPRAVEWARPAIIGGALVAGVILLGAFAGWDAGNSAESQQPEVGVTAPLPPSKPRPALASPPPARENQVADEQPQRLARAAIKRPPAAPRPSLPDDFLTEGTPTEGSPSAATATAPAVTDSPPVETAAAMPLPNAVIARTIERIGYACGQVASTSSVGGGSGIYKVTCTSGHSYQASPVRGRYHFRRLGSR